MAIWGKCTSMMKMNLPSEDESACMAIWGKMHIHDEDESAIKWVAR